MWSRDERPSASIPQFEERLEQLRTQSRIAAVTALIARDQEVVWIRHFGLADIAGGRHPYRHHDLSLRLSYQAIRLHPRSPARV